MVGALTNSGSKLQVAPAADNAWSWQRKIKTGELKTKETKGKGANGRHQQTEKARTEDKWRKEGSKATSSRESNTGGKSEHVPE